jgi:hypothetical protein
MPQGIASGGLQLTRSRAVAPLAELRLAQATVALAGCVPVLAGTAGILLGPALAGATWDPASDSHFRYLSGLLLGIGLAFWSCIPALPHRTNRFRLLAAIVIAGGLARLLALPLHGWPGTPMAAALVMELAVVPLLCLWQARLARIAKGQPPTLDGKPSTLPYVGAAVVALTLVLGSQQLLTNAPSSERLERLRIAPIMPSWIEMIDKYPVRPDSKEHGISRNYPEHIVRWGNLLALKLKDGDYIWLVDMEGHVSGFGSTEVYTLEDYWTDQDLYVVRVGFNESSEHWLISARTAKVTILYATPYRDPANPYLFITVGSRGMMTYAAEVWEGQGDSWVRRYKCDALEYRDEFFQYGVALLRWDGPGRAILAAPEPYHTREFLLAKIDGRWRTDACRDP